MIGCLSLIFVGDLCYHFFHWHLSHDVGQWIRDIKGAHGPVEIPDFMRLGVSGQEGVCDCSGARGSGNGMAKDLFFGLLVYLSIGIYRSIYWFLFPLIALSIKFLIYWFIYCKKVQGRAVEGLWGCLGDRLIELFKHLGLATYLCLFMSLESRRRRTKGSVVGEEWCQNAAPLRWYTKNVSALSKMILSRAWLHDTVSCAAWNDARKGVYLKPLFKTPFSNCCWGWSIPIMLDYRDISRMESVPLMWGPVTASPVGIEPMTIFGEGGPPYNWYPIHNGENSMNSTGWPPNTP